ncbi:allantoicase [Aspergillus chevalieri]|uniref:allantoicase n=1 Tax=Aspergillus chevalieri TaxID=182096 RepID=A0A7R7ZKP6_ASPCH|nr:allantoicase [Aspergillus chevalieri]BCR84814.1 allantoicase [Aspergillus chevalieri]
MESNAFPPSAAEPTTTATDFIPSNEIDTTFAHTTNLASAALNTKVLSRSDDYFASATNLLTPTPPINRPGVFVHTGAWYDGWETRRHNPEPYDWVVIKLGVASAVIKGIEVDTGFFVGNFGEKAEVQATNAEGGGGVDDEEIAEAGYGKWETILPAKACGPSQRRAWRVNEPFASKPYTHVRLLMYPDGGFGRLRLYGHAIPPALPAQVIASTDRAVLPVEELSSALVGGLALGASDQHFTPCSNLLLPGRGENMGDGWETARSRAPGHVDWAIVKLGLPGSVARIVVDTKDFRGNFPRTVRVHGLVGKKDKEGQVPAHDDPEWIELLKGERACKADTEHVFEGDDLAAEGEDTRVFSHVKLTLVPDGGVKRLRILGRRGVID